MSKHPNHLVSNTAFALSAIFAALSAISWVDYIYQMVPREFTTTNTAMIVRFLFPIITVCLLAIAAIFRSAENSMVDKNDNKTQKLTPHRG